MSDHVDSASPLDIPVMQLDEKLEDLSDMVRRGEPIGFIEAIAVMDYQGRLRRERESAKQNSFWGRLTRLFREA